MALLIEDLPIEYYGVASSNYPSPTVLEKIVYLPSNIKLKNILRVYSNLDLIFHNSSKIFKDLYYCICNASFNIEYIDEINENTISIFYDYIYCPLHFHINSNFSTNELKPKISHINLKLIDVSSIYIYLSISPY